MFEVKFNHAAINNFHVQWCSFFHVEESKEGEMLNTVIGCRFEQKPRASLGRPLKMEITRMKENGHIYLTSQQCSRNYN